MLFFFYEFVGFLVLHRYEKKKGLQNEHNW